MLDLTEESILTLSEAARSLPAGPVHISTIHRWWRRGVRGVQLETALRGGKRVTSQEALQRFFARTTAIANGERAPARTPRQRKKAIEAARARLAANGL
jgi:hypothetical protein